MIDSAARAERFDPAPSTTPFYTWEVPQKPVALRLPLALIDRLEHEAVDNFRSLSSRGSEIGGVLWGGVEPGDPMIVSVAEYDLVVCEYSLGPLYRLAETDLSRLDRALSQRVGAGLRPVGFFRSHTRKGVSLDADDLSLLNSRFNEPHQVALVVRPYATKASTAGVFIREDGVIRGEASYLEFPFRSSLLAPTKANGQAAEAPVTAIPAAPPKAAARGQIVPIASRRDVTAPAAPAPPAASASEAAAPAAPQPPAAAVPPPAPQPAAAEAPAPPASPDAPKISLAAGTVPPPARTPPEPAAQSPALSITEPPARTDLKTTPEPPAPAAAKPALEPPARLPVKAAAEPPAKPAIEASKATEVPARGAQPLPPVEDPAPTAPPERPALRAPGRLIWFAIGAIFPVLLSGALFVYPGVLRRTTLPSVLTGVDSSPLQLRVERTGNELLLTWNRDSSAIRNATRAVLQISDGDQHENVDMDLAQLRNGSIVYLPVTADVVFRMEVSGKDQSKTASESVRVLRTRPSPMPDESKPSPNQSAKPSVPGAPAAAAPPVTVQAAATPVTPAPAGLNAPPPAGAPPASAAAPQIPAPAPVLKQFNTESLAQRLRPARQDSISLPDAPVVGGESVASSNSALPFTAVAPALPPAPRKADAPNAPARPNVTAATPAGGNVEQAQLIHRKEPEYPRIAREAGAKGVVELVATIGTNGRVKSVKAVRGHPLLQKAAIDAVMQWIYKPTTLNGHAVETQSTITFNFVSDR